jgi:hypothetical protein
MSTNSTRSHTSCTTSMLNISIQRPSLSVFVMSDSTEIHVPCLRVSPFLTGLAQKKSTDGKSTHILGKPGITQCMICTLNGLLNHGVVSVKNQIHFKLSVKSSSDMVILPVCSTTKFPTQLGGGIAGTCSKMKKTRRRDLKCYNHSLMLTKTSQCCLDMTRPPKKDAKRSKRNTKLCAKWLPRS